MGQFNDFILAGKEDRVLTGNGSAAYGMQTVFALGPGTAALMTVVDILQIAACVIINGVGQHDGSS